MSIKKAGIPFPIYVDTNPDRPIDVADISIKYRTAGTVDAYVPLSGSPVATGQPGSYCQMGSIGSAGYYEIAITIAASSDGTFPAEEITGMATVVNATTDDIYTQLLTTNGTIDDIKAQVDLLDEETVNGLNAAVLAVDAKLSTLTELINDENDPAITSLRELLHDLANSTDSANSALTAIDTYIKAATDDIENMIAGRDTLADGSVNPFKGKTTIDIMNQLTSVNQFLSDKLEAAKVAIQDDITATRTALANAIDEVEVLVTANKDTLEHSVHGLAAIMTKLTATKTEITSGVSNLTSDIAAVSDLIDSVNTAIHAKLDLIKTNTDTIITKLDKRNNTRVIM